MNPRIAFFASDYTADYFRAVCKELEDQCRITVLEYDTMAQLPALLRQAYGEYDGFCTVGRLSLRLLCADQEPAKPVMAVTTELVDYYKNFFALLNAQRDIDFSRVLLDHALLQPQRVFSVADFCSNPESFEQLRDREVRKIALEDIGAIEGRVSQRARQMWAQGAFDILVCRYGAVAKAMEAAGIPCSFVYPDQEQVRKSLEMLINAVQMRSIDSGMPAVVYVSAPQFSTIELQNVNRYQVEAEKALLDFNRRYMANFVMQYTASGYEILTSRNIVEKITDGLRVCRLAPLVPGDACVGYGMGANLLLAKSNALAALRKAAQSKASCVVKGDGACVTLAAAGPQDAEPTYTPAQAQAARASGLSLNTVLRIADAAGALGTCEMTSRELADALQVTIANANHFLNRLAQNGFAEILPQKKRSGKGKPSTVYRVKL